MIAMKRCSYCNCYFQRPDDMDDYHWKRRKTCGSEYCKSGMKSRAGKLGGKKSRENNPVPFAQKQEEQPRVIAQVGPDVPLKQYSLREKSISWLFR